MMNEPSGKHAARDAPDPSRPGGENGASHAAFALLHPSVQRQLYRMRWTHLRPLQCKAIRAVLRGDGPVILAASTASGKTEAAFLPILSDIAESPDGSVRAVYVSPLKALINDQFRRVEDLCRYLDMPVFRWHGDVSASHKAKLVKTPAGVLLITPESLESLFVNRSEHLDKLFGGLRYVVVDELHAFLAGERGLHLRSLLGRLRRLRPGRRSRFRIVGLSATIGDVSVAQHYVAPDAPQQVTVITDDADTKELKLRLHGYLDRGAGAEAVKPAAAEAPAQTTNADSDEHEREDQGGRHAMAADLVRHCRGAANLVFVNAKGELEELADLCRRRAKAQRLPDVFLVHHGSLSAEIREDAEAIMKRGERPATALCSSTLEMGIDIGGVRAVGQVGPPWSVASLKQRLGRSGRKDGEPRVLRLYIRCTEPRAGADVFDRLHLDLVQAVAVVELMLEGWSEPDVLPVCDLSTLTQQIISVIAQHGGAAASRLYTVLCRRPHGAFADVSEKLFARLLRSLAEQDVVEQMAGGDLILGLAGERLRKDRGFYAVFQTPAEYTVIHTGKSLGTLAVIPAEGDYLLFAGRRWQVGQVDHERRHLHVRPARGWKRPRFTGGLGAIHPEIRRKMRDLLAGQGRVGYLDAAAQSLLDAARQAARDAGVCERRFVELGPRKTAMMTWTGSRIQQTLRASFRAKQIAVRDEEIALVFNLDLAHTREAVHAALTDIPGGGAGGGSGEGGGGGGLAAWIEPRFERKYDIFLADPLLDVSIARGRIDLPGARAVLAAADSA